MLKKAPTGTRWSGPFHCWMGEHNGKGRPFRTALTPRLINKIA